MESGERTVQFAATGRQSSSPTPTSPFASAPASQQESDLHPWQEQTAGEQEVAQADPDPELTLPSDAKIARWFRTGRALSRVVARDSSSSAEQPASHVAVHVEVRAAVNACGRKYGELDLLWLRPS